jgi:predicted transcriptional regulator
MCIRDRGTFIDGGKISNVSVGELGIERCPNITFRLSVPDTAQHVGGLTIFGRSFGNYHQDIKVRIRYKNKGTARAAQRE